MFFCDKFKFRTFEFYVSPRIAMGLFPNVPILASKRREFFVVPEIDLVEKETSGVCGGNLALASWHALALIGRWLFGAACH